MDHLHRIILPIGVYIKTSFGLSLAISLGILIVSRAQMDDVDSNGNRGMARLGGDEGL